MVMVDKNTPERTTQRNPPAKQSTRERLEETNRERLATAQNRDGLLRARATGEMTEETRDKLLALGEDVTRASPDPAQVLPDPEPGLTTTTGAYRTPIDPTTAAVPAPENSEMVERMRGAPTIGSGGHGEPEELWAGPEERPVIQSEEEQQKALADHNRANQERPAERPAR
jgi:hypothetical protein